MTPVSPTYHDMIVWGLNYDEQIHHWARIDAYRYRQAERMSRRHWRNLTRMVWLFGVMVLAWTLAAAQAIGRLVGWW